MNASETREWILKRLLAGSPCRFVKYGDGEFLCMSGAKGQTCDGQKYSEDLADALKQAFHWAYKSDITLVGDWKGHGPHGHLQRRFERQFGVPSHGDYSTLLCQDDGSLPEVAKFWDTVRGLLRPIVLVAPESHAPVAKWLKSYHLVVSATDAWSDYPFALNMAKLYPNNPVFLTCAGPMSKVLAASLMTVLDVGSGFDPLVFEAPTRAGQPDPDVVRAAFGFQ